MLETYLISVATKSTLLLAAGLLLVRFSSRANAPTRHWICLTALLSAAVAPLLALWSPQWSYFIAVPARPGTAAVGVASAFASWPEVLEGIWAVGSLVFAMRMAGGWLLLQRSRRTSVLFLQRESAEVRIGSVGAPLTCGVLRPLILLPEGAREWDQARLEAVLLHESAHVRRRDCLAKYIAQTVRTLLWWNPLAWTLTAQMNEEQERACDEAVLAAGVAPEAYVNTLLATARECSSTLLLGCAMSNASALRARVEHLLAWRQGSVGTTRRHAIAVPVLLVLMTGISCAEKIYKVGPGIVPPKVLEKTDPQYTDKARAAKLEGPVELTIVVGVDQRAHDIKVTKSLDPGLDASAITAIKIWRFQPGTKNGKPVPVQAKIQVNFRLQ